MKATLVSSLLVLWLASDAIAQTLPSTLTKVATYTSAQLGVKSGAGGIEFDAAGKTLYVNDTNTKQVVSLTVVRDTSGKITGFKSPTVVVTSNVTRGYLDGGLDLSPVGTIFFNNYATSDLEQYSPATKAHTVTNLKTLGLSGSPGGAEFFVKNGSLLVGDYDTGSLYELPLTLQSNLTYTVGKPTKYMDTPTGIEGFDFIPTGPFNQSRGLVLVNYDNGNVHLVGVDPTTSKPFQDANGKTMFVPLITGMSEPMDVEFDPITKDMFITDYSSATVTMLQFSGVIAGGFDGAFDLFGPGCPQKGGVVPTVSASGAMRGSQSVTISLAKAPTSESVAFLVFGVGSVGNLGGFLFVGTTCRVYANPMFSIPVPTNSSGVGSLTVTIPSAAAGLTLFTQGYALSNGANALNLTVSDAAVSLIGK